MHILQTLQVLTAMPQTASRGLRCCLILLFFFKPCTLALQTLAHKSEEDRAQFFRQWGRQLEKETTVLRDAVREYEGTMDSAKQRGDAGALGPAQQIMRGWFPAVTAAIEEEQQAVRYRLALARWIPCCMLSCGPQMH